MGFMEGHSVGFHHVFNQKAKKVNLIKDVTFLGQSFDEWVKDEKPTEVSMSHERLDDEDVKMVLGCNENNY